MEPRALYHKDGRQAKTGETVTSFRGETFILKGWPQNGRNRVWVTAAEGSHEIEYFPSVFDLTFTKPE